MLITCGLLALLIAAGILESVRHRKNLASIPTRIHVNGTRGKSSVTRLIAAGMRAGGIRTIGKTTGTKPVIILEDGSEVPIIRAGKANIIEQLMVFRRAVSRGARAIVVECMAVQPVLQLLSERRMVRSTIGALTNVRADHLDEMGPTLELVARSLCGTVPRHGILFTTERSFLPIILEEAKKQGSAVVPVSPDGVSDEMMAGFSYIEHKDNVALALAVCGHQGIDSGKALQGMHKCNPDPGVLRIFMIEYQGKEIEFVNAFAANDPDSYSLIFEMLRPHRSPGKKQIILVNSRNDRIERSEQLGEFIAGLEADHFLLAGNYTNALAGKAVSSGLSPRKIIDLGGRGPAEIFEEVLSLAPSKSFVVGIGNIVGLGEQIVRFFVDRGREIAYRSG